MSGAEDPPHLVQMEDKIEERKRKWIFNSTAQCNYLHLSFVYLKNTHTTIYYILHEMLRCRDLNSFILEFLSVPTVVI